MRNLPPDLINHYTLFEIYKDARMQTSTRTQTKRKQIVIAPIRKCNVNPHLFG